MWVRPLQRAWVYSIDAENKAGLLFNVPDDADSHVEGYVNLQGGIRCLGALEVQASRAAWKWAVFD